MKRKKVVYIGCGLALFGLCMLILNWVGLIAPLLSTVMHQPALMAGLAAGAMLGLTVEDKTEIEKLLEKVGEKHKDAIKTEVAQVLGADAFGKEFKEKIIKEFGTSLETLGVKADVIKNLQEAVEKQGEKMRELEMHEVRNGKSVEDLVREKAEDIKKLEHIGQNGANNLIIKLPKAAINKTQVTRASVSGTTMAMRLPDVGQLPYLGLQMSNLFRHAGVDPSSNGVIRYYDQSAITRNAAAVAEGATKPESAITWIERNITIEKIADSIPVTREAWRDVGFIQSEIDRLLNINLSIKEDSYLWNGTGVTPQIKGIYVYSAAFDNTDVNYAGSTATFANVYDLVAAMRVAIMNSKQSKYAPNAVVMNPVDILKYRLAKDEFGRYLFPTDAPASIVGMTVIESSVVTANTLLVGDFRYGTIYDLEGVTVEMGYINDQFVKNAMTILAEKRLTLLVRNVDVDAFLKSTDVAADVAAITSA